MSLRPTVVVADRSEAFLMYLAILLNRLAYEPLPVAGGHAAAKLVRAIHPSLLILGAELADDDPFRLLVELRGDATLAGLPVYFASANEIDRVPALAAGATGFLAKPLALETLHRILEQTHHAPDRQRRSPRAPYPCQVTLDWNGQRLACTAVTLAEGGVYLRRQAPLPQGCLLQVHLPMPDGTILSLEGEVLYTKLIAEGRFTHPPGMAIRFLAPAEAALERLRRTITELLIGDILAEQGEPVIGR
jgi:CheY-like chemotaxis protein